MENPIATPAELANNDVARAGTERAIAAVRPELDEAGVATKHVSDSQIAQLGRRISQTFSGAQG